MKTAKLDHLGRIVIPAPFRQALKLQEGALMCITLEAGSVKITPYTEVCKLCGAPLYKNAEFLLCDKCIKSVKES